MNEIVVKLPKRISLNSELELIRKLNFFYSCDCKNRRGLYLDFTNVEYLDILGLLILYKFLEYSVAHQCFYSPCLINFDENSCVRDRIRYFGFRELINELKTNKDSEREYHSLKVNIDNDFIIAPMALLKQSDSSDYLNNEYAGKISAYYTDSKVSAMIFTVFSEIFLNFWAHSNESSRSIIVAHGNKEYVEIACADSGIGVIDSICTAYPKCKREKALQLAITKGISSKKHTNHMGYGLWLINEIVNKTNGRMKLLSGGFTYDNKAGKYNYNKSAVWQGTIVYVKLLLINPVTLEDIEDNNYLNSIKVNFQ